MARKKISYESLSRLSVILACVGLVAVLVTLGLLLRNADLEARYVYYNPKGMFLPALGAGLFVSLATAAAGFFIGLSTAGQRRNQATGLSWAGFFLSAAVITLTMSAVVVFYFTRSPVVPTQ